MANLTSNDDENITDETVDDPRLIIEILVIFIKSIQDEENIVKSYKTILPILSWFIESVKIIFKMDINYLNYLQYVHNKLLELVNFDPNGFKSAIQDDSCFSDSERKQIETIVKFDINTVNEGQAAGALSNGNGIATGDHIQLKTFG
ncbi:unnamed protein product [[Candida] boidinii]|nr:unnamed protein product [[Candida] boidinii]